MFQTKADIDRNYLYISFEGMARLEEGQAAVKAVLAEAGKLKPGFAIINDLTKARPTIPEVAEMLKGAQLSLFKMGAKKVIRILSKEAIVTKMQFSRTQEDAKADYATIEVASMGDALKSL
jgi:hypothetical protein